MYHTASWIVNRTYPITRFIPLYGQFDYTFLLDQIQFNGTALKPKKNFFIAILDDIMSWKINVFKICFSKKFFYQSFLDWGIKSQGSWHIWRFIYYWHMVCHLSLILFSNIFKILWFKFSAIISMEFIACKYSNIL